MAKNQTFSVSISLLTKNFQKGVKAIQTSLNGIKGQFRNLMSGIGVGLGFKELIDSAQKLDKAQTVLRNVSGTYEAYGENMEFVNSLSKKYNQELTTLMGNYAKFHSVASSAGLTMGQQKNIYESLTRAASYFNLTADETNGVMLAVQQMMGKGKIQAEELRGQLAERLPGAMNLAAKAMGVTTGQLDEMIKEGNVMANELLPLLASELNTLTSGLNVNTLQGSIARLQNAFTSLIEKANIGKIYKNTVNTISTGVEGVANNLRQVGMWIMGAVLTLAFKKPIEAGHKSWKDFSNDLETKLKIAERRADMLKKKLESIAGLRGLNIPEADADGIIPEGAGEEYATLNESIRKYNAQLKIVADLQDNVKYKTSNWGKQLKDNVLTTIKNIAQQLLYGGIAAALSALVTLTVDWFLKLTEVKRSLKDINKELKQNLNQASPDEVTAESLMFKKDENGEWELITLDERKKRIDAVNNLLGRSGELAFTELSTNEEINAALEERIKNLKLINEYQAKQKALTDLKTQWNNSNSGLTIEQIREKYNTNQQKIDEIYDPNSVYSKAGKSTEVASIYVKDNHKLEQLIKLYERMVELQGEIATISQNDIFYKDGSGKTPLNKTQVELDFEKIQEDYNNTLRSLDEQKKQQLISDKEYTKAVGDLEVKTAESILALNDIDETTNDFAKARLDAARSYINSKEKEDKTQEALDKYYKQSLLLADQRDQGLITEEEYEEELLRLKEETLKTLLSMGELSDAAKELAQKWREDKTNYTNKQIAEIDNPEKEERDASFDHRKTSGEILGEEYDLWDKYINDLEKTIEGIEDLPQTTESKKRLEELNEELKKAKDNAESFKDAWVLTDISEEIENLTKELNQGMYENFTGVADAVDRLSSSIKDAIDSFEDPDASGWEQILAIFNGLAQTVDTVLQSIDMIQTVKETFDQLKAAQQAYQAVKDAAAAKDVANATKTILASQAEATAEGTAGAAKLPFPANLIAIATIVGAIVSTFAALPKFAHGGIVQGSSTMGDHNLARVNAGEMILNKQQQSTLFGMLNGSNSGMLGKTNNVEFKIRGSELVGVIKNYNNKLKG